MNLIDALGGLADQRCFILYKLAAKPGTWKLDKIPVSPDTGHNSDAQNPHTWMDAHTALAYATAWGAGTSAGQHGVGIVLHEALNLAVVDIDDCLQADGQWTQLAAKTCARFPGAYIEKSLSGRGLHVFFRIRGTPRPHCTKNVLLGIEVYEKSRFIAMGDAVTSTGSMDQDCTEAYDQLLQEHFPPRPISDRNQEWTDKPAPEWSGPPDTPEGDVELINIGRRLRSPGAIFGGKVSFDDLWTGNAAKLGAAWPSSKGDEWDRSSADQAFWNHLCYLTGGHADRMLRLSWMCEALVRDKWNRDDYTRGSILDSCATHKGNYYQGGKQSDALAPIVPTGAVPKPPAEARIDYTDKGNANLLVQQANGDLRYVSETKQWLRWSGARWQIDTHEVFVTTYAVNVAEHYFEKSRGLRKGSHTYNQEDGVVEFAEDVFKWAGKCRSKKALDAMIGLARKAPGVPISLAELDRNPWLLGVENGVVDLRTGQLREIEARDDYVTRRCPVNYNPNAQAPRWEKAVEEITGTPIPAERDASGNVIPSTVGRFTPRPDLARYLHKALGCSITGVIQEQKFFIGVGPGSNGKGILFDTVMDLLGPYGLVMPSEMFMATKNAHDAERPTSFAASLAGVRFVVSSETKEGQKLDVGVVKNHTGDSKLTARKMRSDPTTFAITHKPWLLTNAPPGIDHIDPAIRGRLHVVPFDRRWNRPGEPDNNPALPDGDKGLMAHLRTHEAEGILAWLVRGAMLYQNEGLVPPEEVVRGTREYFNDQDSIRLWLATLHRCPPHQGTRGSELFLRFSTWCAGEGREVKPATQTAFGKALKQHEIEDARMTAGVHYGVRL